MYIIYKCVSTDQWILEKGEKLKLNRAYLEFSGFVKGRGKFPLAP